MTRESGISRADGGLDRPIREIIYFDLNRVTSYLSQIHDGLTEYLEQTDTSSAQETRAGTQVQVGRGALPAGVTFGRKDTAIFDTTALVERKRDHHAALTVLEDALHRRDVIGGVGDAKPFIKHVGRPLMIDYAYLAKRFRGFKTLQPALQAIGDLSKDRPSESAQDQKRKREKRAKENAENFRKFENFATVLEASEERLELYYDDPKLTVPFLRDFLQLPSEMIEHLYGSPSRTDMTLIGLDVTGNAVDMDLEAGDNMAASTAFMTNLFYSLVGKNFSYSNEYKRIAPLALYIEADIGSIE